MMHAFSRLRASFLRISPMRKPSYSLLPLQAAALSGLDLADRLAGLRGVDPQVPGALLPHCIGLTESFSPVRGTEIGQFPH